MKASETNLQAIIEGTKQYLIPMFQRTYSWEKKQWQQLWADITDLMDNEESTLHFIGSIVTIPINTTTHGVQQFLVIDGQQRLTTLLILLAAVRDNAEYIGNQELANEIQQTLLINPFKSGEDVYKLLPTQVDKEDFKRVINREMNDKMEHSLIFQAHQYFLDVLKKGSIDMSNVKNTITSDLSIVSIILSPEDNPYLVFESLNAKGQPLTQADLIRNFLFMKIPSEDQENQYKKYWLPIQENLGDNLTEFIRHFLLGVNINVKKSEVYIKFKEKIGNKDVKKFLRKLSQFGGYYAKLLDPSLEIHPGIRKHLNRINEFEAKTTYPFLLYIYRDYMKEKYNAQQFCNILKMIENFLVRRFVCNIDSKPLNKLFASLYNLLSTYDANDSIKELAGYLQIRGYPKDHEISSALKKNFLYGQGNRRRKCMFIIKSFENSYQHKEKADLSKSTVEHIMPQTLNEKWMQELGADAEYIHTTYLHTLGNLTLSAYNAELSNEPFSVKKKYYRKSNIQLNKEICQYERWNKENIESRANKLINRFLKIWPYFGSPENEINEITGTSPRLLIIKGNSYYVKTWREVMEYTILFIYEDNQKKYQEIMDKNPSFLSITNYDMRTPKKMKNSHYMEVNLSAKSIYNFCQKIFKEAGYKKKEWDVEIQVK